MTASDARPADWTQKMTTYMRATWAFTAKLTLGVLVVLAAGVFAVATALAGLLIAAAALLMKATGGHRRRPQRAHAKAMSDEPFTLDAHRTAHGWTVE